jgi:two-component system phosphate regulon sensor histidine kinase PhoR
MGADRLPFMLRSRLFWRIFSINTVAVLIFFVASLGYVELSLKAAIQPAQLESVRVVLLTASGALLLAGMVISFLTARMISGPVEGMRRAAEGIARGDFKERLDEQGDFAALASAFNAMSVQLQNRVEEIEARTRELASIMENVSDGLLLVDAEGNVALVNRAATRLLGQSAAQLEGRPLWQSVRHAEVDELLKQLLILSEPGSVRIEQGAGATTQTLEIVATPLFEVAGGGKLAVLLVRDRTEDKRLDQMRRDFLADVSHELKTPLTSIKAYVETLIDGAVDDPTARAPFLEKIHSNAQRLTALVSDILDISRLESSPHDDERQRQDLNKLVERVVAQFRDRAQKRNVTLEFTRVEAAADAFVNDHDMSEAVENLIDNAIKYSSEGSKVAVAVTREDGQLTISVTDSGIGIPQESLHRVFERFYRVDQARSRALGGTGLGLSIVKHVALRHGGKAEAESELGKGSTFTITLPAA